MKSELLNEIYRIHKLSGINVPDTLVESNIILEQGLNQLVRGVEKMLDRDAIEYAERVLPRSTERNIEKRIETYIAQRIATEAGKTEIRNFIKGLAKSSPEFADKFVKANKSTLDAIATARGEAVAERVIKSSFGEEILSSWEKSKTTQPIPPKQKPKKPVSGIPNELKNNEGVKDFQDWLNVNKQGWNSGRNVSVVGKSYGNFGPKTSSAWEKYGDEYLQATKPPIELRNTTEIKDFQDWMDKNHPDWIKDADGNFVNLNQGKGYGVYGPKTRDAWAQYAKEYKKGWEIRQHIRAVNLSEVESQGLSVLERILATEYTLTGQFRKIILLTFDRLRIVYKGEGQLIDETFGKFQTVLERLKNKGELAENNTFFRDIGIGLKSLQKGKLDIYDTFLKDIEQVLKESGKYKVDDVNKVMTYFKKVDPFKMDLPYGDSYALKLLDESTYNTFYKEMRDKNTTLSKKVLDFAIRANAFLWTGSIKKWSEITKFITEKGLGKGLLEYYFFMQVVTKVTLPIFFTVWWSVISIFKGIFSGFQNYSFVDELKDNFEEQYKDIFANKQGEFTAVSIATGAILPWNIYWDDMINTWDKAISGQYEEKTKEYIQKQIDKVTEYYKQENQKLTEEYKELEKKFADYKSETEEKLKEKTQEYSVDLFFTKYPCYKNVLDKSYGDRGIMINGTTLTLKVAETKSTYDAILKPDGKVVWKENGQELQC
jgi:hypothetical protein